MKRLRVLVVDDCPEIARPLAQLLRRWGHEVSEAHSGQHALELAKERAFDAILLDIDMPDLDGFEVAVALRQQEAHAAALLIAATGHDEEEYRVKAAAAGFDHYLTKPIPVKRLRDFFRALAPAIIA